MRRIIRSFLVFFLLFILSVGMTYPLITLLGDKVPSGSGGDVWVHLWTFDWLAEAVRTGQNPWHTDRIFYPTGASLATHNIAWVNFVLWAMFRPFFSIWGAYSMMQITTFALNGWSGYLLLREMGRTQTASWIGALIIAFFPFTLSRYGQPNLALIAAVPLTLLFMHRLFRRKTWSDALLMGLFLGLIGISRWALLLVALLPLIGMWIWCMGENYFARTERRARDQRAFIVQTAAAGLVAFVVMLPFAWPLIAVTLDDAPAETIASDSELRPTTLGAWFIPNTNQTVMGQIGERIPETWQKSGNRVEFIGYTTLILAVVGLIRRPKQTIWAAVVTILLIALALGDTSPIYRFIAQNDAIATLIRYPYRFNAVLSIPLAIMAAHGIESLLGRWKPKSVWRIPLILSALILVESAVLPYGTRTPATPQWLQELGDDPADFAILELPINDNGADKVFMMYQITHGKKLLSGHVSRRTPEMFAYQNESPLIQWFIDPVIHPIPQEEIPAGMAQLAADNICYIVIHPFLPVEWPVIWNAQLGEPDHADEELTVYATGCK